MRTKSFRPGDLAQSNCDNGDGSMPARLTNGHVDLKRCVAAIAPDLPLPVGVQEIALGIEGHVADQAQPAALLARLLDDSSRLRAVATEIENLDPSAPQLMHQPGIVHLPGGVGDEQGLAQPMLAQAGTRLLGQPMPT